VVVILWTVWDDIVRPPGVPRRAARVAFSKDGGWAYCWLDTEVNLNRCRTYNAYGDRLYRPGKKDDPDDVFVRSEGTGPVPESELKIDASRTQVDSVWLRDGIILLPRNDFENQKALVDEILGRR